MNWATKKRGKREMNGGPRTRDGEGVIPHAGLAGRSERARHCSKISKVSLQMEAAKAQSPLGILVSGTEDSW